MNALVRVLKSSFFTWVIQGSTTKELVNPELVQSLQEKTKMAKNQVDWNQPLNEARLVVFDSETTGFYPYAGDEIISLGAVAIESGVIKRDEYFLEYINPGREIPPVIVELTGIDNDMVKGKPDILTALDQFLDFIGNSILVAHNALFDLHFINIKLKRYCQTKLYNPVIDTFILSELLHPTRDRRNLDDLIAYYGINPEGRHTSLGDSIITAQLFLKLMEQLQNRNIQTLRDLFNYQHAMNLI